MESILHTIDEFENPVRRSRSLVLGSWSSPHTLKAKPLYLLAQAISSLGTGRDLVIEEYRSLEALTSPLAPC